MIQPLPCPTQVMTRPLWPSTQSKTLRQGCLGWKGFKFMSSWTCWRKKILLLSLPSSKNNTIQHVQPREIINIFFQPSIYYIDILLSQDLYNIMSENIIPATSALLHLRYPASIRQWKESNPMSKWLGSYSSGRVKVSPNKTPFWYQDLRKNPNPFPCEWYLSISCWSERWIYKWLYIYICSAEKIYFIIFFCYINQYYNIYIYIIWFSFILFKFNIYI